MKNITFINAGAGSGKTYRLTHELYTAIANKSCKADEVLLTTFTNAAAEDIRIKSRAKLLEKGLSKEVNELENAIIGTIHSVGSQMVKRFWHYVGYPKDIKVMDVDDTNFYFNQAIASIPSSEELERIQALNYIFNFSKKSGSITVYDPERWKDDLLKIIELARSNNITDFEESIKSSQIGAKELLNTKKSIRIDYDKVKEAILICINILKGLPEKGNVGIKKKIPVLISMDTAEYIKISELLNIKKVIDDLIKKMQRLKKPIPSILEQVSENLESIHRSQNLLDEIEEYNQILFGLAKASLNEYAKYKQEIGLIDYADMETAFLSLLDIKEVKDEIRNSIKLVLVDEFQDSSPIQLSIFIKLSEIVEKSIWVGDPKQSIFAFRGTDPELIDAIINKFNAKPSRPDLITDNLEYSWRSRPEIVALVNSIFKPSLSGHIPAGQIELTPVRTNKKMEVPALHHFNLVEEKSREDYYYTAVAKSVIHLLKELQWDVSSKSNSRPDLEASKEVVEIRKIRPNDIAILCKTNDAVSAISKELMERGVMVSAEIDGLELTAEYQLVMSLLKFVVSNNNTLAKAEIMLLSEKDSSVEGIIDHRLEFLSKMPAYPSDESSSELESYYNQLNKWGSENLLVKGLSEIFEDIGNLPVPNLIEALVNRLNLNLLIGKWGNADQRRANLSKIIKYAYKYDERCLNMNLGTSLSGFLHYLEGLDEKKESATKNENAIYLSTYHKSKGLEWPVVLLVDFQKDTSWGFIAKELFGVTVASSSISLENILDSRVINSIPWVFGALNATVSEDFKMHIEGTEIYELAEVKQTNELKRLMYVGMTRPRDYLITTGLSGAQNHQWMDMVNEHDNWCFKEGADNESGDYKIFGRDNSPQIKVHKLDIDKDIMFDADLGDRYFAGKKIMVKGEREPYLVSPSKVEMDSGKVKVSKYAAIQSRIPSGKSLESREDNLGNCLHNILYFALGKLIHNEAIELDRIELILANYEISAESLNANEVVNSIEKFYNYVQEEFVPIDWFRELSIEAEMEGQLFKGEIDLLLETKDGFIIIDFKSYLGSMTRVLDTKTSNYAGKYAGQLSTYAKMVEFVKGKKVIQKFIYYTVLGELVELDFE